MGDEIANVDGAQWKQLSKQTHQLAAAGLSLKYGISLSLRSIRVRQLVR